MTEANPAKTGKWTKIAIDYGPLILFFIVNSLADIFVATGAFMVAIIVSVVYSKLKLGRISPMLWFNAVLVVLFGGLTLYLHDERFIKVKPTIIYLMFAAILAWGLWTKRLVLKMVLEEAYPKISDEGWRHLSRNWALCFVVLAGLNELVWRNFSTDIWVNYKVWGTTVLVVIFAMTQAPLLMRHAADEEGKAG